MGPQDLISLCSSFPHTYRHQICELHSKKAIHVFQLPNPLPPPTPASTTTATSKSTPPIHTVSFATPPTHIHICNRIHIHVRYVDSFGCFSMRQHETPKCLKICGPHPFRSILAPSRPQAQRQVQKKSGYHKHALLCITVTDRIIIIADTNSDNSAGANSNTSTTMKAQRSLMRNNDSCMNRYS